MPSFSAVKIKVPSAIRTLSFPDNACPAAVISYVPPVTFRSSLDTIPCPSADTIVRLPVPFNVRSDFVKITASMLLSSIATYSSVLRSVFCDPSASVTNTFSALFTYTAALEAQVMSTLSNTICTFALSASTTICPSDSVPEKIYVPSAVIVTVCPLIATPSVSPVIPSSESVT